MFYEQIKGHWCPDMANPEPEWEEGEKQTIQIQNPSVNNY
jgi:hypothetical protein